MESDSRMFVFGNYMDEVLMMRLPTGTEYFYGHDHLYSPAVLFSSSGTVSVRYEYDAYGRRRQYTAGWVPSSLQIWGNYYAFTGRELDWLDGGNLQVMYYRARYYDPDTGRFLQHDPLGIDPAGGNGNSFRPTGQYADRMNGYEYVKSRPLMNQDPFGLETAKNTDVCCKIKTTTRYIPHGSTIILLPYQETSCMQVTISNPQGWSPGQACRCRYKNQKNVQVYGWHAGECCWCDVFIGWATSPLPAGDADTDVRFHTKFYIKCDQNSSLDFTAETTPNDIEGPPSIGGLIIGGYPVRPRIDTGSSMHLKGYSWSYKGRISCANAEQAKMVASAETYWSVFHNCWHWAHQIANTVLEFCP